MKHIVYRSVLFLGLMCILFGCSDEDDNALGSASVTVENISPTEGFSGTEVTVTGTGFTENSRVFFNETEVEEYVSRSAVSLVVKVPENASTGRVGVLEGEAFGFSTQEFTFIPSAVIESISPEQAPVGETVTISGSNFFDVSVEDIVVRFGDAVASVVSASSTAISVVVPDGAENGPVSVQFGDIQTVTGPEFTVGELTVEVPDVLVNTKSYVNGYGTFKVDDNYIDGTNSGAYLIYEVTPEADGLYEFNINASTNQAYNVYVNVDMGVDAEVLADKQNNSALTRQIENLGGWTNFQTYTYGAFKLNGGQKYYVRIFFLADGTSWVANVKDLILHYADNQEQEGINVDADADKGYNLYAADFDDATLLPFLNTAVGNNYIKAENGYAEFYYDADDYKNNHEGERAYKGAELRSDNYETHSEGWYGFKLYLPTDGLSEEASGTIITQIFNSGYGNTWAGHMHIDNKQLVMSYRGSSAADAEKTKVVCEELEWDKWIDVVIYFRAGRNDKGAIKVWVGDNIQESSPTCSIENINFGFSSSWIDDTRMDDSYFGCKFGLYVADNYTRTIRMDNIRALNANPTGAFDLVNPENELTE